ncbi:pentatricopeptide repeat-containing protein At5g50990 isoform X1 [Primulina eburnea]|uniref:pentatricopeptide repeat-containing protein At5g50990 isoform X1 n=1 Tax=Primulina eburnea TaxID=1245227 RepID=UPI003C6C4460
MKVVRRNLFSSKTAFLGSLNNAAFIPQPSSIIPPARNLHSVTDDPTLLRILEGCKLPPNFRTANSVHGKFIKHGYGIFVKVGEFDVAKKIFLASSTRDVVTWNSTIGGCVKDGYFLEAIGLFKDMVKASIEPDKFTFASAIAACSRLGALNHGQWVHELMIEKKVQLNYILSSALIDMYSRCGRIEIAKSIFDTTLRNDVSIWNAMIKGLAMHGLVSDAVSAFSNMQIEKISPDPLTFISILTTCSHCGFVDQGRYYFDIMQKNFSIQPQLEHYGAMVDLFGRAGLLEEAYALIQEMPMEPDVVTWRALLSACKTYKNHELGEIAVGEIKNLESGDYILLSNMYCSVNKWDDAETVRHVMNKKGVRKCRGRSWVELHGSIHYFKAGDRSHPETEAIYRVLEALIHRARMEGYVCARDSVFMDISEEEKEENLNYHSEKLTLAYGILKSSPGTKILISKNLRTCTDCHSWMKIVSKVLNRIITVRDRMRFHSFEKGSCTCGDYW